MNTLEIEADLANKYNYCPLSKDMSDKYRKLYLENIPTFLDINGDNTCLYTKLGMCICTSYDRIVIGDYGAFIEYTKEQAITDNYIIKPGQEYRIYDKKYSKHVKYHWYTTKDDSNIKIYWQRKTVKYADYLRNRYYVSPHEVYIKGK